jgi:hypothetical protein
MAFLPSIDPPDRSICLTANRLQSGGARRDRTDDILLAKQALSQLSYGPNLGLTGRTGLVMTQLKPLLCQVLTLRRGGKRLPGSSLSSSGMPERSSRKGIGFNHFCLAARMVGPGRLELPTSRLSGVRSNHLSYGPSGSRQIDQQARC